MKGLTPEQKWVQGTFPSLVRQPFKPASIDWSRPDCEKPCEGSALYNHDKSNETAYLSLSEDRNQQQLIVNLLEKSDQVIGG